MSVRGLDGTLAATVVLSGLSSSSTVWFQIDTTFTTDTGDCRMWEGDATMTGEIYGSGGTTYYTLTGSVEPKMPFGLTAGTGTLPQPLLLTNEVLPGSPTPANAVSLNYPVTATPTAPSATITFGLEDCSYGLGGSVDLVLGGGSAAAGLANALTPPAGVTTSLNDLFGAAGALPPNLLAERNELQYQSMVATLGSQAAVAQALANRANQALQAQRGPYDTAVAQQTAAQQQYDQAKEAYLDALDDLGNATDAAQFAEEFPLVENEIGDAQAALTAARRRSWPPRPTPRRPGRANAADVVVTEAQGPLDDATQNADEATATATAASKPAQAANSASLLRITVDLTYCSTCEQEFSATFDGELYFGPDLVGDLDADLAFGTDDDSFLLTVGAGPRWIFGDSFGPVGFSLELEAMLSLTVGYSTANGWDNLSISVQAGAQADAWISAFGFTDTADLASISISGDVTVLPSWSVSGSYSFDVFDIDVSGSWSET